MQDKPIDTITKMVKNGKKIAMLTCYDATFAKMSVAAGVDVLLVGDSLGMVLHGAENTLNVSIADMAYHTRAVANGAPNTLIIADMPVNCYEHDANMALTHAKYLLASGAHCVKLEGAGHIVPIAAHLIAHGVPVCAHLGFTPQSVIQLGGYKIQGKTTESAAQILRDAQELADIGVHFIVLEMVPARLAKAITASVNVPTIGIGAGVDCDGQVLVLQDLLGIYTGPAQKAPDEFKSPRFVRNFLKENGSIQAAIKSYVDAVKAGTFPAIEHSY